MVRVCKAPTSTSAVGKKLCIQRVFFPTKISPKILSRWRFLLFSDGVFPTESSPTVISQIYFFRWSIFRRRFPHGTALDRRSLHSDCLGAICHPLRFEALVSLGVSSLSSAPPSTRPLYADLVVIKDHPVTYTRPSPQPVGHARTTRNVPPILSRWVDDSNITPICFA